MINLKDPQVLRDTANTFDSKVNNIRERLNNVKTAYGQLFESWKDKNSADIEEVLQQINVAMDQITEKAGEMKTMLNNEAAKVESVQARIDSRHGNREEIHFQN